MLYKLDGLSNTCGIKCVSVKREDARVTVIGQVEEEDMSIIEMMLEIQIQCNRLDFPNRNKRY